jgi:hypothetical protein
MAKASVYNCITELVKAGFFTKIVSSVYKVKVPVDDMGESTCGHLEKPIYGAKLKPQGFEQKENQIPDGHTSHTEVLYELPNGTAFSWSGETSKQEESLELFLEFVDEIANGNLELIKQESYATNLPTK